MLLRAAVLLLFPASVLAHPGHGALEMHWHADDLVLALLGAAAVVAGIVFFVRKKSKR
jgi:LPXTG-motif cell wall-anchored protein